MRHLLADPVSKGRRVIEAFTLLLFVLLVAGNTNLKACTAFHVKTAQKVFVGNNEDAGNPETKIWVVPAEEGKYGRVYFGFSDLSPQGGINEKGLWFDAFGLPFKAVSPDGLEIYPGDLQDRLMASCATVNDVLAKLKQYSRSPMTRYQWMFGDREGNSVIIEGNAVVSRQGPYQVVTNFRQSQFPSGKGYECNRYQIATEMLNAHPDPDINTIRNILTSTHSEGQDPTLYSYIADLTDGLLYVYHFHNFENVVVLDVRRELSKGEHVYSLPGLFPRTHAAESFEYQARSALKQARASRRDKNFNPKGYPQYWGRYVITSPEILARQLITIDQGADCLNLHLNGGGAYEVIPESSGSFVLLSYGGMEFACKFERDSNEIVNEFSMEGSGLSIKAKRIK